MAFGVNALQPFKNEGQAQNMLKFSLGVPLHKYQQVQT